MSLNHTPRIYVACLAAYNNGILHGRWIDASTDAEEMETEMRAMLAASPIPDAEEWAIHDDEGFGKSVLHESDSFQRIAELVAFLEEHGELGKLVLSYYAGELDDAIRTIDNYLGEYASLADYACEITEETTEIPPHLENYIDYEAIARDMELNGDVFTIQESYDAVHIFHNH